MITRWVRSADQEVSVLYRSGKAAHLLHKIQDIQLLSERDLDDAIIMQI
jgi:hypothetical protein